MSFQAYLDALEDQAGHTSAELLTLAHERVFTADSKATEVVAWLKSDFGAVTVER